MNHPEGGRSNIHCAPAPTQSQNSLAPRSLLLGFAICLAAAISGCSKPAAPHSNFNLAYTGAPVSAIAGHYTNYVRVTPGTVFVNPELAMLCRGVTQEEVEAARLKYGPHANAAIVIYMNRLAARAFRDSVSPYPVGSVIVKEKSFGGYWDKNGKPAVTAANGVGGMVKRPAGFDPEHGDWEYFYFQDPAKIESGRIASCVNCHQSAKATDYVFGAWRTAPENASASDASPLTTAATR